jgi:hypothetical protein
MMTFLWLKTILIVLPHYVLAGMAISLALTRSPWPIGLVYGVDLIGAASGCLLVLALMTWLDGALFAVGAAAAGASVCFRIALRRSGATERLQAGWFVLRHPGLLALLLAGLAAGNAAIQPRGPRPGRGQEWLAIRGARGGAVEFILAHPRRPGDNRRSVNVGTVGLPAAEQGGADESHH